MKERSALYVGTVMHRRLHPRPYRLQHAAFWILLDLDEIGSLDRRLWLFSRDRFNAISFHAGDHGEQTAEPLRQQIARRLRTENLPIEVGTVRLLCMPRVFGYCFNPLSIYFCEDSDGRLAAIIYEVRNTFGGRHSYVLPVDRDDAAVIRQACAKAFYVSPFLEMALNYQFRIVAPQDKVAAVVITRDAQRPVLVASLTGQRVPITDRALLALLLRVPFLTLKVIAAIHWHALRMWMSGFVFHPQSATAKTAAGADGGRSRR